MRHQRYKVDKKLDNRREPINATLLHMTFAYGDKKITIKKRRFVTRSGYCLDSDDGHLAASIADLNEVQEWHGDSVVSWEVTTYPDLRASAIRKIVGAVMRKKREWQREVDKLVVPEG